MDDRKIAGEIYGLVGGRENVANVSNCMTRLRLTLHDMGTAELAAIKKVDGVLGVNCMENELQIIFGPSRVNKVADAFKEIMARAKNQQPRIGDGEKLHQEIRARNDTPIKRMFKQISSIFLPLIPAFIACGLLTGILAIAAKIDPSLAKAPMWNLLAVMGNSIFWGMNLFVGYQAARVFGGTPILGGALAAFVTHPGLKDIVLDGSNLLPGRGGIISVVLIAALAVFIEKRLHRWIPEMFDLFLTPLLTMLISGMAAIFVFQPIGGMVATAIGTAATSAIEGGGAAVGFVLAGVWLPMVMFGIHQAFTPIHVSLLEQYGVTILLPILAMAGAGQVGAAIAVYFKSKNRFLKKTVLSALPIGMMGVGEPLIYGVTFPLGRPFLGACIGAAFGGALEASFMVGARAMGISGLPLAPTTDHVYIYLLGILVSYIAGFIATWVLGFDDPPEEEQE